MTRRVIFESLAGHFGHIWVTSIFESLSGHFGHIWVTFMSLSGQSLKVAFKSLLGHFNYFGVWGSLGGKPITTIERGCIYGI